LWGALDAVSQWEFDFGVDHFKDGDTFGTNGWVFVHQWSGHNAGVTDLDGGGTGTVTGRHFGVQLFHGTAQRSITVLFVHIVAAGTGVVAKRNTVHVDNVGVLLHDFTHGKDVAGGFFHFAVLMQKVPETRFRLDGGFGKDLHAVDLRSLVVGGGSFTPRDLVLVDFGNLGSHLKTKGGDLFWRMINAWLVVTREERMKNRIIRNYCNFSVWICPSLY
jgi:hypothetical protein